MDSRTHVEFAEKLLGIADLPAPYSVASLFPQIDRYPHVFHRMYAHTVFKARRLSATGLRIMNRPDWTDDAHPFDIRRFREEQRRFETYLEAQDRVLPDVHANGDDAALLAYVSHLYLDTFNQPTQPFSPVSIYCSGQWTLWERIGDFRLTLYTTPVIDRLRADLFADSLWASADRFSPTTQIEAMLRRLCRHSLERIDESIVAPSMAAMALADTSKPDVDRCEEFLAAFENVLTALHLRHLDADAEGTDTGNMEARIAAG